MLKVQQPKLRKTRELAENILFSEGVNGRIARILYREWSTKSAVSEQVYEGIKKARSSSSNEIIEKYSPFLEAKKLKWYGHKRIYERQRLNTDVFFKADKLRTLKNPETNKELDNFFKLYRHTQRTSDIILFSDYDNSSLFDFFAHQFTEFVNDRMVYRALIPLPELKNTVISVFSSSKKYKEYRDLHLRVREIGAIPYFKPTLEPEDENLNSQFELVGYGKQQRRIDPDLELNISELEVYSRNTVAISRALSNLQEKKFKKLKKYPQFWKMYTAPFSYPPINMKFNPIDQLFISEETIRDVCNFMHGKSSIAEKLLNIEAITKECSV